ncbi:hypothetical protein COV42_00165 [Candidatus Campbellbacteria bacterium CG11_big_fil_rev_8_21_14_0_20_44_21]|uniref:Uncharacterized protein n=1 Tax=Candidatus Campbellbacteria bacterium CG22_combo_CG10-13_8_21_14_all_43_18 TaxID=1974530 RepID=A0A2H0DYH7_9BACT|nr:MAG: hypothetical protein COW82_00960 [Candidatus Campbellbacteria bacterium CG22_combo_CG10-13_8_21_14_all_43_18]PIR24553.1 MAG: hypothetical protein COV42_00165 [Candidatus Campbellbacteria bacterium CG11_big_fil_rev_8_21_14_0_20_44_21]
MFFLKESFQKIKIFLGKLNFLIRLDSDINWVSLVILFLIINIFFLSYAVASFYNVSSDEAVLVEKTPRSPSNTLNRGALEDVLSLLRLRKENYRSLLESDFRFVDPSL